MKFKKVENQFNMFKWLYWGGFIALVIFHLFGMEETGAVIGRLGIIGAMVFYYILLYKAWRIIPEDKARTTPGKAVGFLFIPFYNLYWIYIAIRKLGEHLIEMCSERNIPISNIRGAKEIPPFFLLFAFISSLFYLFILPFEDEIPNILHFLHYALISPFIIFQFLFIKDVKNAMTSIMNKDRKE